MSFLSVDEIDDLLSVVLC